MSSNKEDRKALATIWGYGLVALSLILAMFVKFSENKSETIAHNIQVLLPYMLVLTGILWTIQLNVTFFDKINSGSFTKDYQKFTLISSIMTILELLILFNHDKNTNLKYLTYILSIINLFCVGSSQIVMKYMSTDG
jgi:heme/copper-type cytochrome/quinol oxidase subunit 4